VGFLFILSGLSASGRRGLVDIGSGGEGSETVIVSNLFVASGTAFVPATYLILIPIPVGTRIAARWQDSTGGTTVWIELILLEEGEVPQSFPQKAVFPLLGGRVAETIGDVAGSSTGTAVTAAGSANTKGSWVEIASSTSKRTVWMLAMLGIPSAAPGDYLVDIGVGAGPTVLIPDLHVHPAGVNDLVGFGFPVRIAAGTSISARCQSSTASRMIRIVICLIEEA
jgi:hypothetical protein